MNSDQLAGNWKQVKGNIKDHWGKLTNDDMDRIEGQRDKLVGRIQEQYGKSKQEAEREVDEYLETL